MITWFNMRFKKLAAAVGRGIGHMAKLNGEFVVFFLGTALLAAGAWWMYPPAGLLVGGAVLIGDVVMGRIILFKLAARKREGES